MAEAPVEQLPAQERSQAQRQVHAVQLGILKLQTAELAEFRDALRENEDGIQDAIKSVKKAIAKVNQIKKTLDAATKILKVVGKILPSFDVWVRTLASRPPRREERSSSAAPTFSEHDNTETVWSFLLQAFCAWRDDPFGRRRGVPRDE